VGRVVNAPAHSLELTLDEGHSRRAPEAEEIELRSPRGHNTRGYMAWTWLHTRKALPTWLHTRKVRPGRARWQEDVRGSSEAPHRPRLRHRRRRLHKANGYSSGHRLWRAARELEDGHVRSARQQPLQDQAPLRGGGVLGAAPRNVHTMGDETVPSMLNQTATRGRRN
jgi:hypothetical protein